MFRLYVDEGTYIGVPPSRLLRSPPARVARRTRSHRSQDRNDAKVRTSTKRIDTKLARRSLRYANIRSLRRRYLQRYVNQRLTIQEARVQSPFDFHYSHPRALSIHLLHPTPESYPNATNPEKAPGGRFIMVAGDYIILEIPFGIILRSRAQAEMNYFFSV